MDNNLSKEELYEILRQVEKDAHDLYGNMFTYEWLKDFMCAEITHNMYGRNSYIVHIDFNSCFSHCKYGEFVTVDMINDILSVLKETTYLSSLGYCVRSYTKITDRVLISKIQVERC